MRCSAPLIVALGVLTLASSVAQVVEAADEPGLRQLRCVALAVVATALRSSSAQAGPSYVSVSLLR
jgi:hypothetical protein